MSQEAHFRGVVHWLVVPDFGSGLLGTRRGRHSVRHSLRRRSANKDAVTLLETDGKFIVPSVPYRVFTSTLIKQSHTLPKTWAGHHL